MTITAHFAPADAHFSGTPDGIGMATGQFLVDGDIITTTIAGIGTMTATMLPYTLSFLLSWSLLLVTWVLLGWPVGPGAPLFLSIP